MTDATGTLTIVFNGEIYNYQDLKDELLAKGHIFHSRTDTEVILAAYDQWGIDCLSRLNGMFAFALHDASRQVLLLARDRAGEKPLFYSISDGKLHFASELKGLMADPEFVRRVDHEALDCYLAIGYVPGNRNIMLGLNKLSPAHALLFNLKDGTAQVWRYWQLPAPPGLSPSDAGERVLLDELEVLLEDAVRRQMIADVPVGVLLSGGVDSSLITAMAVRASQKVKTFTVSFSDFPNYDESNHALLISRYFGTEHLELVANSVDPDILAVLARQYDEPIIDSSIIPTYLVSNLVRQHCTVALGGDGGDELFGGYAHYNRLMWTRQAIGWVPQPLRNALARGLGGNLPIGFKGRNWLQAMGTDLDHELPLIASYFDVEGRRGLLDGLSTDHSLSLVAEKIFSARFPHNVDLLQRITRMDFENYMPEDILVKIDRASMINSLELRAPLLDYRIIEFAFGRVPTKLKATSHQRKILLKKLAVRLLPPEFDRRRKQGFSIPLAEWLKGGRWRDFFHDVLLDGACIFDRAMVKRLLHGQDVGRSNGERLFGLVMFELWRREYQVSL